MTAKPEGTPCYRQNMVILLAKSTEFIIVSTGHLWKEVKCSFREHLANGGGFLQSKFYLFGNSHCVFSKYAP